MHFYIEKNAVGASTETTIEELSEDGSLKELARLSGAAELTPSVLANAKEMKELAEKINRTEHTKEDVKLRPPVFVFFQQHGGCQLWTKGRDAGEKKQI